MRLPLWARRTVQQGRSQPSLSGQKNHPHPFLCALGGLLHPSSLQGHCGAPREKPGPATRGSRAWPSELLHVAVAEWPAGARHNPHENLCAQRSDHEEGVVHVGEGDGL